MRLPLRTYLLLVLGVLAALPVLVLGLTQTSRIGAAQIRQTEQSARFAAESLAQDVTQYLDLRAAELDSLAREVEAQPALDPAALQALLARRRVLSGHFTSISVGDRSGTTLAAVPMLDQSGVTMLGRIAVPTPAYRALVAGALSLGWLEPDPITAQSGLRLLAPAWSKSGTRLAYVDAMIDLGDLQRIVQRVIDLAPGMRVAIVDSQGSVLAGPGAALADAPGRLDAAPLYAAAGVSATSRLAPDEHGDLVRAETAPITARGLTWTAVAGLSEATVQTQAGDVQRDTLLFSGAALLAALLVAAALAQIMAAPIRDLAAAAAAIGRGEAPTAMARPARWYPSELRSLILEVGAMARRLLARHDELEREVAARTSRPLPARDITAYLHAQTNLPQAA